MMGTAFAAFEEQKRAVADFEKAVAESETTVTAKNHAITVTVDGRGELTDVKFPTNAYRKMAPAELSSLLVETVTAARDQARKGLNELLETIVPTGMAADFLTNSVDVEGMLDEAMHAAKQMFPSSAPVSGERL
jgi:DNA-binding protein YbaB